MIPDSGCRHRGIPYRDGVRRVVPMLVLSLVIAISGKPLAAPEPALREALDSPLLFTKRHNYQGIHIYDTIVTNGIPVEVRR